MRIVVSNSELPHLWAHQTQCNARNSGGTFYFNGDTIYSYGRHFPIARHVQNGAILFTTQSYGSTTSHHMSAVRQAIPKGTKVIHCLYVEGDRHNDNIEAFNAKIQEYIGKSQRAWLNAQYLHDAAKRWRKRGIMYCKFYQILPSVVSKVPPIPKERLAKAEMARKSREEKWKAQQAKWEEEQRKRREREKLELPAKIELWRQGGYVNLPYNHPTMLRISADEVVTSKGAHIPVEDARKAIQFVRHVIATGQDWKRNGEQFKVGPYNLDAVTRGGQVTAGCHVIELDEIELLASKLEFTPVQGD